MIILGIDPAIRISGYGVVELRDDATLHILDCGVIENKRNMLHSECLRRIYGGTAELLEKFKVDCAAIEEPFVGRNGKTAIILGMARGAFVAAVSVKNVPIYSYSAKVAKKSAVGSGSAEKTQVAMMIAAQLNINIENIMLDATDALAIAVCHAQRFARKELAEHLTRQI